MSNQFKSKVYYRSEEFPELIQALRWVRRASNSEDVRPWMHYIHVAGGNRIVGTDGARLHVVIFDPNDKLPAEGTYLYEPRNQSAGYLVECEKHKLPANLFDLLKHNGSKWEKLDWAKMEAETTPADLYRLITLLGVRRPKDLKGRPQDPYGFNPDYLTDALQYTGHEVHVGHRMLYMRSPVSAGYPVYKAVVAGMLL